MLVGCSSGNAVGFSANCALTSSGQRDRRDLRLVAEDADLLRAEQLGAGLGAGSEQRLEPVGRRPVVGVLEQVGVVVGLLDDLLHEPVRADVALGVQQRHLREALRRSRSAARSEASSMTTMPSSGRVWRDERLEAVLEPLLALEVRDDRQHASNPGAADVGGRGRSAADGRSQRLRQAMQGHAWLLCVSVVDAAVREQVAEHALGVEVLARDLARGALVARVVAVDRLDRGDGVVEASRRRTAPRRRAARRRSRCPG